MIKELGYCSGIGELFSLAWTEECLGSRPSVYSIISKDYLMVIDESHVTIPQVMQCMVVIEVEKKLWWEYGFRLPVAMDNRPLKISRI